MRQSEASHLPLTGVDAQESKFAEDVEESGSKAPLGAGAGAMLKKSSHKVYQASWVSQVTREGYPYGSMVACGAPPPSAVYLVLCRTDGFSTQFESESAPYGSFCVFFAAPQQ